ncbi:hypothetical protein ABIA39_007361 [Nocardia sp. GAS34]
MHRADPAPPLSRARPKAPSGNAIEVPEGAGPELEKRFAHRAHAVENSPGFLGFQLLRPVVGDNRYFVVTQWDSEEAFAAMRRDIRSLSCFSVAIISGVASEKWMVRTGFEPVFVTPAQDYVTITGILLRAGEDGLDLPAGLFDVAAEAAQVAYGEAGLPV